MTAKLTNIYMQWEYWIIQAKYWSIKDSQTGRDVYHLYIDALNRCNVFQSEFEEEMKKGETI